MRVCVEAAQGGNGGIGVHPSGRSGKHETRSQKPHIQFPRGSACAKGDSISRVRPCCPDSNTYY